MFLAVFASSICRVFTPMRRPERVNLSDCSIHMPKAKQQVVIELSPSAQLERPMSKARQRWVIGAQTIAAISSLLSNDMNLDLQERACAALANILSNCTVRPLADDLSRCWAASLTPRSAAAEVGRDRPHRR